MKTAIVADLEKYRIADLDRIGAALACGANLRIAKEGMQHGQWLPFLGEIGLAERTAQRWMQIADWDTDSVRNAGGIAAAEKLESDYPTVEEKMGFVLECLNALHEQATAIVKLYPAIKQLEGMGHGDKGLAAKMVDCLNDIRQVFVDVCPLLLTDGQIAQCNTEISH